VVDIEKVVVVKPTSLKIGDRFKDKQTGKIYILKWMLNRYAVHLELTSLGLERFWGSTITGGNQELQLNS